jgi:hypothetical protein
MTARIYCQAPSATQSGPGPARPWVLEFDRDTPRELDPLMGWTSSSDTKAQIKLRFATKEEAVRYAERNYLVYRVEEPKPAAARRIMAYSDNFKTQRVGQWTH